MTGFLMMGVVAGLALYLLIAGLIPAMMFQYLGRGERAARAEYGRMKRECPDAPEARLTEPEFVERFVLEGPRPWRYVLAAAALVLLGIPASCAVGVAGMLR